MTTFNKQQLQAINALGENIVVSASAGAGKTTVLIERLMKRILKDGVSINRICALTFTDAAANEMKKRLLAALYSENEKNPSSYLTQQMMLVETAHISTIHSFCLSLIKDHGYQINISEARTQNILDPAMVTLYQKQAMQETLDAWAQHKEVDLETLLHTFTSKPQATSSFTAIIQSIAKYLLSKHDMDHVIQMLEDTYSVSTFDELIAPIKDAYFSYHHLNITLVLDQIKALISHVDMLEDQDALSQTLLIAFDNLRSLKSSIENKDTTFESSLISALDIQLKTLRGDAEYKELGDSLAETINRYVSNFEPIEKGIKNLQEQKPLLISLISFTQDYLTAFSTIKEAEDGLDFDDFEHLAYKLLIHNNYSLSKTLQNEFDEIMVDEFQDTNDFQDAIIQLISNGSNIFRVGDVKQSIYRFRGAKPSIMQNLIVDTTIENIYLSYNYRSKSDIVSFNNDFFDTALNMTQGMTYSEYDHVDTGIPSQTKNSAPIELLIVTDPDPESLEDTTHTLPWHKDRNMRKARVIAQQVIQHHAMGYSFKDIVILVRSHTHKTFLKRAFEEVNIPHYIDDRGGFYHSSIIEGLLHFFEFAISKSDYSLAKLLTTPFMQYSYDQLIEIRKLNDFSLYEALRRYDLDAYMQLKVFVDTWHHQDIVSCILDVINLNNAYHTQLSVQDKTNIDALLEKAIAYQKSNNPTLYGFMEFVRNLDDTSSSEAIPLSSNDNVVTAMTIHQSKGLQFPVVIMWSMGRRSVMDHRDALITDDALGIAFYDTLEPLNLARTSFLRHLIESKQDAEDLEETLRLVYVALTRPQERLVVVDVVKDYTLPTLNHDLLYHHKHMIDLLSSVPSKHRSLRVVSYDSLDSVILPQVDTTESLNTFTALPLKETVYEEIDHSTFAFNPDFLEATQYGTQLHNAVELLPPRTWNDTDLYEVDPRYHHQLRQYNQHPYTQKLYTAQAIENEVPFLFKEAEIVRNGIIDALYHFEDMLVIVDFKTDNADVSLLKERYTTQLATYKKAVSAAFPEKSITTYIYSFHNNEYIEV